MAGIHFSEHPRVGVGVLVVRDGLLLLGERIHSHGADTWCPPGGHLEFGESPADCAARELREETGLAATEISPGPWTNDFFQNEGKHYITLFMIVKDFQGDLQLAEPEKCARWEWFPLDRLPSPLFLSLANLIKRNPLSDYF